jgi:hypothetical protein
MEDDDDAEDLRMGVGAGVGAGCAADDVPTTSSGCDDDERLGVGLCRPWLAMIARLYYCTSMANFVDREYDI